MATKYVNKYKLTYFDARGRGEVIRLIFALKGYPFEDNRIPYESWENEKSKTPFGWLPVLTIDDMDMYCDSMAIARYLAKEFGFGGTTSLEMLEIDQVVGIMKDIEQQLLKFMNEKDEDKKKQLKEESYERGLPRYLSALEKILTKNGGEFYVGKSITLADIAVFDGLDQKLEDSLFQLYPKVKANHYRVANNERIQSYLDSRKETAF